MPDPTPTPEKPRPRDFRELPPYARTLLQVRVQVSVTLAAKRQKVEEVMALVPGSLLMFDKPCDAMLEMSVGDRPFAEGDVVKVGEKFGLRLDRMLMPDEHFLPVRRTG
ncbi:flagellar motor switch protein [Pirellulimonas nuda]|uniref:Flagellar motor switch protein n=1 Tax=Pirellulimonas nuda TaxID=2528009 RepID=A0A518D780_9BACT|nr:FliM/FliN family flagellar motor C-terminal domain-containing protein [Pirellulimonas nuda]QDU87306.1 flagellar motor switch protein [Pirellulimonas nuda]